VRDDGGVPKHPISMLPDDVERLRQMLVWLIETQTEDPTVPCGDCGHDIYDHADDDEGIEGRCHFPRGRFVRYADTTSEPAPDIVLCRCEKFV
jgi:hypothetical protein